MILFTNYDGDIIYIPTKNKINTIFYIIYILNLPTTRYYQLKNDDNMSYLFSSVYSILNTCRTCFQKLLLRGWCVLGPAKYLD